jgi:hypothetical protein
MFNDISNLPLGDMLLFLLFISLIMIYPAMKSRKIAYGFVIAGGLFQFFHTLEHIIQLIRWALSPYSPPYMSPVAKTAAKQLESTFAELTSITGIPTIGMELLHLVGNAIFLSGGVVLYFAPAFKKIKPYALYAFLFEAIHLAEHLSLTYFAASKKSAWGSSTLFNLLSGPQLTTHRILWHFTMNVLALAFYLLAVSKLRGTLTSKFFILPTLLSINFLPYIITHISVDAPTGFRSTSDIFSINIFSALFFNPIALTIYYIIFTKVYDKRLNTIKVKK